MEIQHNNDSYGGHSSRKRELFCIGSDVYVHHTRYRRSRGQVSLGLEPSVSSTAEFGLCLIREPDVRGIESYRQEEV